MLTASRVKLSIIHSLSFELLAQSNGETCYMYLNTNNQMWGKHIISQTSFIHPNVVPSYQIFYIHFDVFPEHVSPLLLLSPLTAEKTSNSNSPGCRYELISRGNSGSDFTNNAGVSIKFHFGWFSASVQVIRWVWFCSTLPWCGYSFWQS